jgi:hypothetical protein
MMKPCWATDDAKVYTCIKNILIVLRGDLEIEGIFYLVKTSLSLARFGKCDARAQLPAPMTPTRIFDKVLPQSMVFVLPSAQSKELASSCQEKI